jgi:hypothetical protein
MMSTTRMGKGWVSEVTKLRIWMTVGRFCQALEEKMSVEDIEVEAGSDISTIVTTSEQPSDTAHRS